jgi:pimeloyl-ACP methyl ester carboxylesterase
LGRKILPTADRVWPLAIKKRNDIAAIKSPTLLVFGDADAVPPSHVAEFFALLGGGKRDGGWDGTGMSQSRLAILPGTTHYVISAAPALLAAALPFLEGRSSGAR